MKQSFYNHTFDNGLVLVAERMPSLESAAFTFLVPAGSTNDPADRSGLSTMTCEMVLRGAGSRDSRQFIDDLENLGIQRNESVSASHSSFSGATLASNLPAALSIYADLLRRPHLPADQLEAGKLVAVQELRSLEDDPSHKVMLELRRRHYPDPWGRPSEGTLEAIEAITNDEIHAQFKSCYRPNGAILGVAGNIDWPLLKDLVGQLLGDWKSVEAKPVATGPRGPKNEHLSHESNQTQIGIAYASVPFRDPNYINASAAVGVLSGGMSARLFTEVREKRGLCYSVYASYHTLRDHACVLCYAGTSVERAQETLDVTMSELDRLSAGIDSTELQRLKARVKSSLIMQQESSSSRSGALAREWYHLGRVRTLEEIGELVDSLTTESINSYLAANPPKDFTVLTLGPSPLNVPGAGSPSASASA
ncbi:MAG: pitrilysin family protein [Planctomycetota bacterium]|nr:pitrilysin family protein [Planctomycetota bacterium]